MAHPAHAMEITFKSLSSEVHFTLQDNILSLPYLPLH
jgi:hypothetical protein